MNHLKEIRQVIEVYLLQLKVSKSKMDWKESGRIPRINLPIICLIFSLALWFQCTFRGAFLKGVDHMEVVVGIIVMTLGMLITYLTFVRNRDKDIIQNAKEEATILAKLVYISRDVDGLKIDIKTSEKQIDHMQEQFGRIDENIKSAHKRLDRLESDKGGRFIK